MNECKVYIKNSVFQEIGQATKFEADKSMDGISRMCISVVEELFQGIGSCPRDVPVFFGSAYSSISSLYQFNIVFERDGALRVNPSHFPNTVLNSPFCRASIYHHITSPILNICTGKSSAMNALLLAYNHMVYAGVHHAIVCSAEETCDFVDQVEGKKLLSSCGALYLTDTEDDWRIVGFLDTHNESMDNSYGLFGSTNLLYKIHNVVKIRYNESEKREQENMVSITDGNRMLMLSGH